VPDDQRLSVERVVEEINRLRGNQCARVIERASDIADYAARHAQPGDILLVMSNGGFDAVHDKILHALAS
jgi:UDP-N-acetylmuramate: L-alanyl-gamma-D-glutamyl-meso-diaminopimelate ligase